ncbi:MAG: lipid A biosynthesis acyltransferase [Betaproteobacteria bacterium]|nr:lipid A biosynthesis acyltransferase [Betaproteobacteria bacterium]MDH5341871.1 lipid A biosynthesis acyltransferase [Betaproteobacteria bacterium]
MTRFGLALVWLLHWLPLALLAPLGKAVGLLLYAVAGERRRVVLTNLKLCFPELPEHERVRLARRHFAAFARALLEHGILWWGSRERVMRMVRVEGLEHWQAVQGRPVIWLAPHFVGLDMGGSRIITEWQGISVYSQQKNPVFDRVLLHGRTRFVKPVLFSRQDGIRPVVKAMRTGLPFYYLPDMDFGERDSIFVPFFGVPAATITGLARMAQLARAVVLPAVTTQLPGSAGYVLRFYPAWEHYPSGDVAADTRRMNAFIEERVREMPEQYYWLHKRFKTRPPGEARFY